MESPEIIEVGALRGPRAVKFVDLSGLDSPREGWTAAFLVYDGEGRAGLIEYEQATAYYKFMPADPTPGLAPFGDFSVDALKRRVAAWLASRSDA